MTDRTVAVLAGGLSHERDVSLRSGRRLSSSLRDTGLYVEEWDVDAKLISRINSSRPDAVVIALHGGAGENGAVGSKYHGAYGDFTACGGGLGFVQGGLHRVRGNAGIIAGCLRGGGIV